MIRKEDIIKEMDGINDDFHALSQRVTNTRLLVAKFVEERIKNG